MSILLKSPIAGTTQLWDVSKDNDDQRDEDSELANRTSLYVDVFQNIHDVVMDHEKFLFLPEELAYFQRLNALSYPARYLLIRLCLRKRGKWHSLADLEQRYKIEIGGKEHISNIIDELCGIKRNATVKAKDEEPDIIDLTQDKNDDVEPVQASIINTPYNINSSGSLTKSIPQSDPGAETYAFAEDDANASLPELLSCLTHDELKSIGKQMKVTKAGQNRSSLSEAIVSNASSQTTLAFPILTLCKKALTARKIPVQPIALSPAHDNRLRQAAVVRRLVSKSICRCIRISHATFLLFDRLNTVFFRSTIYGSPLLLPALLTAFRKRRHADTNYIRTAGIFSSRQALLDYEEALALEARIDEALSRQTLAIDQASIISLKSQGKGKTTEKTQSFAISPRVEAAKVTREIWTEVYDRWKVLVSTTGEQEKPPGLERFDCGHVLTRIICKGAEAHAILKEHNIEIEVLRALLAQTKWRKGRRGAWYDRLALVLMTHLEKTHETLSMAMDVVINGLQDPLTHLVYRPRLERRLTRLETMLSIPMSDRHKCDGQLKQARDLYVEGIRIKNISRDKTSQGAGVPKISSPIADVNKNFKKNSQLWKGKTLWLTKDGEEVSVEQFALEYYSGLGFKGFHSEGRIISTIFGLLFWDVIFASIPGAFETPFQSAPLDILEDTFCSARQDLIDKRLAALERGEAHNLLAEVLNKEGPHRTSCIGVDWDFQSDDLLEIVDCLGGRALAVICQMICEEYGQWQGGVPDLLVWNFATRECRFVEVKSPKDRLQENQKVWIDVLISSETPVDLCHVVEKGHKRKGTRGSRACNRMKLPDTDSDANTEVKEQNMDRPLDQILTRVHDSDSDSSVLIIPKKRKVNGTSTTLQKSRKKSDN